MKILMLMKMNEPSFSNQLKPLIQSKNVSEVMILRDTPGPALPKTKYYCIPSFLLKSHIIKTIYKFFYTIFLCLSKKPNLISAYYLVPHGIIATFAAKICQKSSNISLIGTDLNIWCKKSIIGSILFSLLKLADTITITGNAAKEILIQKKIDKNKIFILPNVIDSPRILKNPKKYDLIYVGRLAHIKRIDLIITAVSKIKKKYPSIKVAIVGSGPLENQLKQYTKKLNIQENFDFLGFKKNIYEYLSRSKIFISTSESEGLPYTLIEAMTIGMPIIITNVGCIDDIIVHEYNGLLVNSKDIIQIKNAILKLLEDKNLCKKLSMNAIKIKNRYLPKNATKIWEKILEKIS